MKKKFNSIFSNFVNLAVSKSVELLVPILAIPLLISRLGIESYGVYIYAFSIFAIFSVLVRLGLDDYGVKQLTQSDKHNEKTISLTYYSIKFFLAFLVILTSFFAVTLFEINYIFLLCSLVLLGDASDSIWFFLSKNNLRFYTFTKVISKVLYLLLLYLNVQSEADLFLVPIFYALISFGAGLFQMGYVYQNSLGEFNFFLSKKLGKEIITKGSHIVGSNFISVIKDRGGFISLGLLGLNSYVGIYDIIYKVVMVLNIPPQIISTSYFPRISSEGSKNLLFQSFFVNFLYSAITIPILILIQYISNLLFSEVFIADPSVTVAIFCACFFYSISINIAKNIIIISGNTLVLLISAIASSLVYISALVFTFGENFDVYMALYLFALAYAVEMLVRLIFVLVKKVYNT